MYSGLHNILFIFRVGVGSALFIQTHVLKPTPSIQISLLSALFLLMPLSPRKAHFSLSEIHRRHFLRLNPALLPLTEENVEKVFDEVRLGLMADGENMALHDIDGLVVVLKLQGACGSCPSSTLMLKMGIKTRLLYNIPEIKHSLILQVVSEIRPYLAGIAGGKLELVLSEPAAGVMTVCVALTQKLREKIPAIAAVQLID
ncbi:hypothetical protein Pfo_013773 [Paulownia fortunei]|nr:hypothetical protein Pfo_013773 [Paulownia fortunei]